MKSLLNGFFCGNNVPETRQIADIHKIEISQITTTASLHECEPTMMYDCLCTFNDKSTGSYKLIRTHDYDCILRDIGVCVKLDYLKQWKEHKAFHLPVRILVLNYTLSGSSFDGLSPVDVDVRHAYPGLQIALPTPEVRIEKVMCAMRELQDCKNDFQRWCYIITNSIVYPWLPLPAFCRKEPFRRAVKMIDMEQFPEAEQSELEFDAVSAMLRLMKRAQEPTSRHILVKKVVVELDFIEN